MNERRQIERDNIKINKLWKKERLVEGHYCKFQRPSKKMFNEILKFNFMQMWNLLSPFSMILLLILPQPHQS